MIAEPARSEDLPALLDLVAAASAADGVGPVSEEGTLSLRSLGGTAPRGVHRVVRDPSGAPVGYAGIDEREPSAELVVHPDRRRSGAGRALVEDVLAAVPGARLWAHGDLPAARALAASAGLRPVRDLWQMRRPLQDRPPSRPMPAGLRLRPFVPGHDDEAWVAVNARAFASHPEQGRMTTADLRARMDEPWFEAAGLLLAVDGDDRVLGFHWTKVHPATGTQPALGEVYVVGVDPDAQGRGLGAALTGAGLDHLAGRGVDDVVLYVDGDNEAAVRTYRRQGFERSMRDVQLARG